MSSHFSAYDTGVNLIHCNNSLITNFAQFNCPLEGYYVTTDTPLGMQVKAREQENQRRRKSIFDNVSPSDRMPPPALLRMVTFQQIK